MTDILLTSGGPAEIYLEGGLRGAQGVQGDTADQLVQSVNTQQGDVVLDYADVGADASGSASAALASANTYTTTQISAIDYPVDSVAGKTGTVTLVKGDVGLSNVDNTSDASKPISTATQTALDLKATIASLATVATTGAYNDLSGKPTIPVGDMTKAVYDTANNGIVDNSEALNAQSGSYYLARANHTGTQAAATITGLAVVALSGSYSDLTGTPAPYSPTDATTGAKGIVQLAGDLGGTAALPTTPTAVHLAGTESVTGAKTFSALITFTSILKAQSGYQTPVATRTSGVTLSTSSAENNMASATGGSFVITLPSASGAPGQRYTIKKIDASANTVTITRAGSDLIDGATTKVLATQYETVRLVSDSSSNWYIV